MTKIIAVLSINFALALALHADADALMGDPCQSSGAPVNLDIPRAEDADFSDMPDLVQKGMVEHQEVLGIDMGQPHWPEWPDCYGSLETSWACAGDGWWCTCWKMNGEWECGCETGNC